MTYPIKPEVCVVDGKVAVFLGADYKFLELAAAQKLVAKMQGAIASLRRDGKRIKRANRDCS